MSTENGERSATSGLDMKAAISLSRLAGILRAEAVNGLYWGAEGRTASHLRAIHRIAARMLAAVDHRPLAWIDSAFATDSALRTPIPGFEFQVGFPDGSIAKCARRLRAGESFTEWSRAFESGLSANSPAEFLGFTDTDEAGMPCPHTFLSIFRLKVDRPRSEVSWKLPPSDSDLVGLSAEAPMSHGWKSVRHLERVKVSSEVRAALDEVAALAREGLGREHAGYDAERFERILAICEDVEPVAGGYPRVDCGDLTAYGLPTGSEAAIFDSQGRLLLIQRTDSGQWAIPGGACEVGETVDRTAIREAFEETGLRIKLTGLIGVFDPPRVNTTQPSPLVVCYSAKAAGAVGTLRPSAREALDARWFTEAETRTMDYFAGHRDRAARAFALVNLGNASREDAFDVCLRALWRGMPDTRATLLFPTEY